MPERIVLIGYGTVGARFVEELLPAVTSGLVELTVVGAEAHDAYNRVLIAEYAVGQADRERLEMTDTAAAIAAGVRIVTGTSVTSINRSRHTITLGTDEQIPYDRLVLATGARSNVPTLDGITKVRRDFMKPPVDARTLDSAEAPLPRGITVLRDVEDAQTVLAAVQDAQRIVVLGAGVLGMELALAAARAGSETCVVYHSESPMDRNLDRGGGTILAASARRAGVTMINHARAESVTFHTDEDGSKRFEALVCADGKQIHGDLLVLSCGVHARTELAYLAGLEVSSGIVVDEHLRSWTDSDIYAIGDCAHVATRPAPGAAKANPPGGPSGLVGPGWRQADWLAARFIAELSLAPSDDAFVDRSISVVMLKAEGIDVVAAGVTKADPWDQHEDGCASAPLSVAQWADPEHSRYTKMVTRDGILEGFVCVGMPRTAAELTLLFERGSELPADRSMLLRYDGPDYEPSLGSDPFAVDATVCWCNGVTVGAINETACAGNTTIAGVGSATRAGTGCGGCKNRIGEVLARFAEVEGPQELAV
ncbi:MAG: NAD(P)/FAD-dependent oxidoreductase [Salinibacterium sp.]|nr:MAG: NAD(P)/FAD-dependent oxidoreductase [Salinibacterium sp.]